MKRMILLFLSVIAAFALAACETKPESQTPSEIQIANPWKSFGEMKSAEQCAGFELGLPEIIGEAYKAVSYSVLDGDKPLLQVGYQDEEFSVEVRKSKSVGEDISGVYGFENTETKERNGTTIKICRPSDESETPDAVLTTFEYNGFTWSLYAPNGYWGDSGEDFLNAVFAQ